MKKVVFIGVPVVLTLAAGVITFVRIKKIGSDVYQLKDYDSVKISNGKWFRYSRGYGGYNALDFLIKVRGMDFKDAVQYLIDGRFNYLLIVISVTNETIEQAQNQIKILRSITNAPIAVIADEPVDAQIKIAALTNGADQFIISPLSPEKAAVSGMALIRRFTELSKSVCPVTIYYDHGILISIDYRKVVIGGKEIELFKKEFDILSLLVRNHAKVLAYEQIFYEVWGDDYIDNSKADNTLEISIGSGDATITQPDGVSSIVPARIILDGEGNVIK